MRRSKTEARRNLLRFSAPIAFVAILGVGATACGSSGGAKTQNPPAAPASTTPATTAPPGSGGAGF